MACELSRLYTWIDRKRPFAPCGSKTTSSPTPTEPALGIPATIPSWGGMVAEGQRVMLNGWWLAVFPGLAISALVICLALIGDGLQETGEASA